MKRGTLRLLRISIPVLFLLVLLGCEKYYPKDLSVGVYEVNGIYNYPNDSSVTEIFDYYGPVKTQGDLRFTVSASGMTKSISFNQAKLNSGTITFQIQNLNSGVMSNLLCSFETIEIKKDYIKIQFSTESYQGDIGFIAFLSGELTFKKIQ